MAATYSGKVLDWNDAITSKIDVMPNSFDWNAETPNKPSSDGIYPRAVPGKTSVI